jgi:butyryl-CoA dehydrogenase
MFAQSSVKVAKGLRSVSKCATRNYTNWPYLKEEHIMISQMCRNFAETELKPIASKIDKSHEFPAEQLKKLGELGMMGVAISSEFGGSGMDALSYAIAMEEISRGCASTGVIMSGNNSLFCAPVDKFANIDQKKEFLVPW